MLKNYSLLSLLWVVPAALLLGTVRFVYLVLGRRFEEAFDVAAAWGWNLAHLPGTLARRRQGAEGSTGPRPRPPALHGVRRVPLATLVRDRRTDPRGAARDR